MIGRRYLKWEGVYEKYSTVTKKYSTVMIITVEYGKFVAIEYTKISGVIQLFPLHPYTVTQYLM